MNILLISPQTPDTFWSFSHVMRIVRRRAAYPPLGLLTVAAMLPRDWNLDVLDLNVAPLDDARIRRADAVFISAMIVHEESVRRVIARCRAMNKTLVGGGPLFTTGADRFPDVDCCVIGEAEDVIAPLVGDLREGRLRPRYQAVERPDITTTPLPRWDLINVNDYVSMSIQASRGCPFDCEFCDITAVYGRRPRVKSPAQFIDELEAVLATRWDGELFVVDDNFIGDKSRCKQLLRAIIDWRRDSRSRMTFTTEASINLADDSDLLDLMVRAGFKHVFVGIESPNENSLRECGKIQNLRSDMKTAVRKIHNAGIQVMGGFIVGFDTDDPSVFDQQRRFISETGIVTAMVGMLTALPGTRLFTRLTREGRIIGQTTGNNLDAALNFITTLDRAVLTEGYRQLVRELYSPHNYYVRILSFLKDYRPSGPRMRIRLRDLRAFVRSSWKLGVAVPGRWAYWTFLCRAWIEHRRAFAEAVDLAIRGHHFRTVSQTL